MNGESNYNLISETYYYVCGEKKPYHCIYEVRTKYLVLNRGYLNLFEL